MWDRGGSTLAAYGPDDLAADSDQRRTADDNSPLPPCQRFGSENLAAEFDDEHLPHGDGQQDQEEFTAPAQAEKDRMACFETLGVEQIGRASCRERV